MFLVAGVITAVYLIDHSKSNEINPQAVVLTSLTAGGNATLFSSYVHIPLVLSKSLIFSATVPLTGTLYFFYPSSITFLSASQGTVLACGPCPQQVGFSSGQIAVSLSTNQTLTLSFSGIVDQLFYMYITPA